MLLVISSQRSIYIPLLTYLFQNLFALRFFLKIPKVTQDFIWAHLVNFKMQLKWGWFE